MEKKLQVKNLTISFRTSNGKVQAVRGINFDLTKGETLAIVGESGSGKSVTSKAILGISAGNAIIEGGEIIYDGKDLLKISEEEFHKIRGDKIAMIFQDPMSSLNPIVKIGRQLTEAMLLKGKARQRDSRATFNAYLKLLNQNMIEALAKNDSAKAAALTQKCKNFDRFERTHLKLENAYNVAHESAVEASADIHDIVFEIEKKALKDASYRLNRVVALSNASVAEYVVHENAAKLRELTASIKKNYPAARKTGNYDTVRQNLSALKNILDDAIQQEKPNFFAMAYCVTFSKESLPKLPVVELNRYMRQYLDEHFMLDFIADAKQGLMYAAKRSYTQKEETLKLLATYRPVFEKEHLDHKESYEAFQKLAKAVEDTIDHLELVKDSFSYTFRTGMKSELDRYFAAIGKNKKEEARYTRQQARYDKLVSRGKTPDGKVVPAAITDLSMVRDNILRQIDRLIEHYKEQLSNASNRDYDAETVALIDCLKENASGVVAKVTKRMAKDRAIKLMEEVGIPNPRRRYNQYPFEFSGGMRQRIVIAIALAANPDILICDEPTTALDVTIQSQILELINKTKRERNLSVIFITHDLGVVANMADRIAVMYAGKIVEYGTAEDIFYHSAHPYTWALLSSMPDLDTKEKLDAIPGTPPNMIYPPVGDAFAARNKYAMKIDFERQPPMFQISDTHYAATWLLHPDAPKIDPPKIIADRISRMQAKREAENGK